MVKRFPRAGTAKWIAIFAVLSACATVQPTVVERLDEQTAVTITNSRTPIIMSPDTPHAAGTARDYLQIGAIEVNRMGTLQYYLWLGISNPEHMAGAIERPKEFESIVFVAGSERIRLDIRGWTPEAIGASEPVYRKLFRNSSDAYYQVTLDNIQQLADADSLTLYTTGSEPTEFVPWYEQTTAKDDLAEFIRVVRQ